MEFLLTMPESNSLFELYIKSRTREKMRDVKLPSI